MWLTEESAGLSLYPTIVTAPPFVPPPPIFPVGSASQLDPVRSAVRIALQQDTLTALQIQPPAPTSLSFPRTAALAIGGDQQYKPVPYASQVTGKVISSSGFFQESSLSNPIPWMGRYDIVIIGGNYEGWDQNSTYDRAILVDSIKQITNIVGFKPTVVWQYHIYESNAISLGQPYNSYSPTVSNEKWLLYNAANQGGSPVVTSGFTSFYSTNWAVAWPSAAAGVSADQQFSPGRTTATYDGKSEDLMQYASAYFIELTVARHTSFTGVVSGTISSSNYTDPRWYPNLVTGSNNDAMKAPNLDAFFMDNQYLTPQNAGYYDLQNNYAVNTDNKTIMAYLARGEQHYYDRYQKISSKCYPGRTYLNCGNIGQWLQAYNSDPVNFSTNNMAGGLLGTLQGGLIEVAVGPSYAYASYAGTVLAIQAYQGVFDFCSSPKQVIFHGYVTSNTDFQTARYALGIALMADGFCCLSINGDYSVVGAFWPDEFGGNPGTNIPKGWLGNPVGNRPSAAAINGVWIRDFSGGTVVLNPSTVNGSGATVQTITSVQINSYLGKNYSFKFFSGSQNPTLNSGLSMSSVTLQTGDAVLLRH